MILMTAVYARVVMSTRIVRENALEMQLKIVQVSLKEIRYLMNAV